MSTLDERYVIDKNGERIGVVLDIDEYRRLMEELEELDSIRAYDTAKASCDEVNPLEDAAAEIEQRRA